jgi:hypothetical protein
MEEIKFSFLYFVCEDFFVPFYYSSGTAIYCSGSTVPVPVPSRQKSYGSFGSGSGTLV